MKRDAPYNPNCKSTPHPAGLEFRLATTQDRDAIANLMFERNPTQTFEEILKKTDREIALNASDPNYRIFVADLAGKAIGLCRYFHSDGLPKEKHLYPSPPGWYCMGILVSPQFRRQSIARFLFKHRLQALRDHGATTIYSMVDADNLASMQMHENFGFKKISAAPGYLNIQFECDNGFLFNMDLL